MKSHILFAGALASTLVLFSSSAFADDIATILGYTSGTAVTLDSDPVVTAILSQPGTFGGRTYSSWSFLAQDSSGSIDLFGAMPTGVSYSPAVGDKISAAGTFSPYHQIPEIGTLTDISLVSSGNPAPGPSLFTIPDLNVDPLPSNIAGHLVEVDNVTIEGASGLFPTANTSYTINDGLGNSMVLYYWYTSYSACGEMSGTPIPTGPVNIIGFESVYPSTPSTIEFIPMQIIPVPEPGALALLSVGGLLALGFRRRR